MKRLWLASAAVLAAIAIGCDDSPNTTTGGAGDAGGTRDSVGTGTTGTGTTDTGTVGTGTSGTRYTGPTDTAGTATTPRSTSGTLGDTAGTGTTGTGGTTGGGMGTTGGTGTTGTGGTAPRPAPVTECCSAESLVWDIGCGERSRRGNPELRSLSAP
jgi:hypothetical protein